MFLVCGVFKRKMSKDFGFYHLCFAIIASNSVYLIIAPIGVGAMLFCSKSFSDLLIGIKKTALVLLIPIVFTTAISAKTIIKLVYLVRVVWVVVQCHSDDADC